MTPDNHDNPQQTPSEKEQDRSNWTKSMAIYSAVLADLIGFTGAGIGLGYLGWAKLGFPWWFLLTLTLAGFFLAMYRLYVQFVSTK